MTPGQASAVVGVLMAAYPDSRWSESTIELYETMVVDLDYDVVRNAVGRLICTCKFLPKISEIRERAREVACGPARAGVEAWGDVMKAIHHYGYMCEPEFQDPLVAQCVRIMGWRNLCLDDVPVHTDRARFCELYEDLQQKQIELDVVEPGRLLPAPGAASERRVAAQKGNVRELPQGVSSVLRGVGVGPVQTDKVKTGTEKARRL